jgi:hypothetical protein
LTRLFAGSSFGRNKIQMQRSLPDNRPKFIIQGIILVVLILFVSVTGCIKSILPSDNSGSDSSSNESPAITDVGTPIGNPSTKTIGSSGGTLTSPDGKFDLTVPAGALNSDLAISIQPVSNEAPGGIGVGYDLLPNGTKFNVPVTLTYHYADSDIVGTNPELFFIATQDSLGEWHVNTDQGNVDTTARTVSISTPHFSQYVLAASLHLEFQKRAFRENESGGITAWETLVYNYGPDLVLERKKQVPDNELSHWSLNGQGTTTIYGNIIGSGASVTFQAPSNIDKEQTVQVSTQLNGNYIAINHQAININQVTVFGNIELVPEKFSYDVSIDYEAIGTSPCIGFLDHYSQLATFRVDIAGDSVLVSDVVNNPPSTTPTSGAATDGSESCSYNASTTGALNLLESGATGVVSPPADVAAPGVERTAVITVPQGNIFWPPSWTITYPYGGGTSPWGGDLLPTVPLVVRITVNDQPQSYGGTSGTTFIGTSININITITPIN